jgi:LytS/YehU family sensor histidine kinase
VLFRSEIADMRESLRALPHLLLHLPVWAGLLRFFLPPYVLGLCAIALVMMVDRHHREALRAAKLACAYAEARMSALSTQLQPHFLFNSLHATMGLIDESPRQASVMLARLGDFLRHALETSHSPWVDVATELAGLEAYLAVQQTRFSDRLIITIDASPQALGLYVPSLLLQPLAENAIEHGRTEGGPTLQVRVLVTVVNERLCIAIHNSSPRLSADLAPAAYGLGLANVSLRLRAAYGPDAQLVIGPDVQGGTTATLDLPARRSVPTGAHA